ncbi:Replicative DNA helicase [wastewater metagenome]|uniref:DNA 5'-3' helicase n=2 Tax=unclassified sequences TaxID=12908 RepID=A0A5B8RHN4_9ZZZZ|nr:DnaB-like helicase C-terminal domain-containing protein [Arhodomonas sp. KWT]QEA06445.1 replicative DNA helicase [uncultured organism]
MTPVEEAVLGAALFEPSLALETGLAPAQFSDTTAAAIWQAVTGMASRGDPVDAITLIAELGEPYRQIVGRVASASFSVVNIRGYARSVAKDAKRRHLRAFLDGLDTSGDPDEVVSEALSGLLSMGRSEAVREHDMAGLMGELATDLDRRWESSRQGGVIGVPTGFGVLDRHLGGLHPSDLVIVAARPGMGKTAFLLSAAKNAAHQGKRVGIVSAEMAALQLGDRLLSAHSGVPATKLRNGALDDADFSAATAAMSELRDLPIRVMDPDACRPADIVQQAHVWAAKGLDCLWIDYLTRLRPDSPKDSRTREVGEMVFKFKSLAKRLNIPVVVLAQLNRSLEQRPNKRPMLSDLRDSGEVEQEADEVLFLYRDASYNSDADPRAAEILIGKNRHGPAGVSVPMRFIDERMTWLDPDMRYA